MSFLDDMLDAAKKRVITKIENPRAVQTAEQRQVTVQQQPGVSTAAPSSASTPGVQAGILSKVPGGSKTLIILGGSIVGFVVLKKLKVI